LNSEEQAQKMILPLGEQVLVPGRPSDQLRLHQACLEGDVEVVKRLLDRSSDLNIEDEVSQLSTHLSFIDLANRMVILL
jgi:ankyrin repeat protein